MTTILYTHYEKYTDEADRPRAVKLLEEWRDSLKLDRPYEEVWMDDFVYKNWLALKLVCRPLERGRAL